MSCVIRMPVTISVWSWFLLVPVFGVPAYLLHNHILNAAGLWTMFIWIACMAVLVLRYPSFQVSLGKDELSVRHAVGRTRFRLDEIESVQIYHPGPSDIGVLTSCGLMGYWGWRRDEDFGLYFAYYGRRNETMMLRLKSGKLYRIGCYGTAVIVENLNDKLRRARTERRSGAIVDKICEN